MKICHVTDYLPKYHAVWAGAEQACYNVCNLLTRDKTIKNIVISTKPIKKIEEEFDSYSVKTYKDYFGSFFGNAIKTVFPYDLFSFFFSYKLLKKIKPDILHLHNFSNISFSIISAARKLKIPIIYSVYDFWLLCPMENLIDYNNENCIKYQGMYCYKCVKKRKFGFFQTIILSIRTPLFKSFIKKIDKFIVLANRWQTILKENKVSKNKVAMVHLPLHKKIGKKKTKTIKDSVLFIGWIEKRKGLEKIIKAMPIILKDIPNAKLYAIGVTSDERYKREILEFINKHKLKNKVFILGKKPHNITVEYIKKSEIVVVPEQWEIAWPIALFEAMAYAKPTVSSRIGGIPEFIKDGENGFLVNPKDSSEFAKKIILLLKDKDKQREIGINARKSLLEICDEKRILEKLSNAYNFLRFNNIKCVVLCAGKGTRFQSEIPKVMVNVKSKPILAHVIDYWKQFTNNFIFVVGYKKEAVVNFVKTLPINSEFVEQKELKGIAHAISLTKNIVSDKFIVVLGDCICKGNFKFPSSMEQGVGVWETNDKEDIKRNFSVDIENSKIKKVVEKPKKIINNLCGMGFYFFNKKLFSYIEKTNPSELRNEIEITDVIQKMIDNGEVISPMFFKGKYLNITYQEDLKKSGSIIGD